MRGCRLAFTRLSVFHLSARSVKVLVQPKLHSAKAASYTNGTNENLFTLIKSRIFRGFGYRKTNKHRRIGYPAIVIELHNAKVRKYS